LEEEKMAIMTTPQRIETAEDLERIVGEQNAAIPAMAQLVQAMDAVGPAP
jgi:hypothetical protein